MGLGEIFQTLRSPPQTRQGQTTTTTGTTSRSTARPYRCAPISPPSRPTHSAGLARTARPRQLARGARLPGTSPPPSSGISAAPPPPLYAARGAAKAWKAKNSSGTKAGGRSSGSSTPRRRRKRRCRSACPLSAAFGTPIAATRRRRKTDRPTSVRDSQRRGPRSPTSIAAGDTPSAKRPGISAAPPLYAARGAAKA